MFANVIIGSETHFCCVSAFGIIISSVMDILKCRGHLLMEHNLTQVIPVGLRANLRLLRQCSRDAMYPTWNFMILCYLYDQLQAIYLSNTLKFLEYKEAECQRVILF